MAPKSKKPAGKAVKKTAVKAKKATTSSKAKPAARKVKAAPASLNKTYKDAPTKTEILTTLAEFADVSKKQVTAVFTGLADIINGCIKSKAAGEFTFPGLLKIKVVRKPATKARKGISPFTGEETIFKAKPARNVVKIKALKKLKDMVA
ncbi:MAG: integration host factor [Gammaproteobacteria bacterium]|jgi:nucleoid DNA-binding protein|nr:integration host factor [Gammaproteobacteria bacterium]